MKPIYLDYNATTPIAKEVADAMYPYLYEHFGNPSSGHEYGQVCKQAVEKARVQLAQLINAEPEEIVFTSGGTESNNYAIKGIAWANREKGNHIIISKIEHPATLEVCKYLESQGFEVTYIGVDEFGCLNLDELNSSIRKDTILISVMHANNETGSLQPIKEISQIVKENGIYFHTDAAQSIGKEKVDVKDLGVDLLSVAGHKLYAPKGIGALYIQNGVQLEKLMHGANHERNLRAGTENVLEIVGLGEACKLVMDNFEESYKHMQEMRELFWRGIQEIGVPVKLNGHPDKRLINTLNVSFEGRIASELLENMKGLAASAGAACHSDGVHVSHVLQEMQVEKSFAQGAIRFSTGKYLDAVQVKKALTIIEKALV